MIDLVSTIYQIMIAAWFLIVQSGWVDLWPIRTARLEISETEPVKKCHVAIG